jgi:hypothetical protein
MNRVIRDWLSLIQWLRSPITFSDFENLKWPEHYERNWFFARQRCGCGSENTEETAYGERPTRPLKVHVGSSHAGFAARFFTGCRRFE